MFGPISKMISNASPIINLGKQGVLELLKSCFKQVIIPKAVYDEINIKKESIEAKSLEKGIGDKWINIEEAVISPILNTLNLGNGEKEAISLASKHRDILLIDDDSARKYASLLNGECHGIIWIIYISVLKGFIDKEKAKGLLEALIGDGFYVSTEIYADFINRLEALQ